MQANEIENTFKTIIVEKMGYPMEVLQNNLQLEADLGIDSIKVMSIFSDMMDKLGIEKKFSQQDMDHKLKEIYTIQDCISFFESLQPNLNED